MSKSIMQSGFYCYECGRTRAPLERHHVFNGNPNRKLSEQYGLWVYLCPECHRTIHNEYGLREHLKTQGQRQIMKAEKWDIDDFRRIFGKNYL